MANKKFVAGIVQQSLLPFCSDWVGLTFSNILPWASCVLRSFQANVMTTCLSGVAISRVAYQRIANMLTSRDTMPACPFFKVSATPATIPFMEASSLAAEAQTDLDSYTDMQ